MTEGNYGGCGKLHTLDWLLFLGYVLFLKLRLVLKLSIEIENFILNSPEHARSFRGNLQSNHKRQAQYLLGSIVFHLSKGENVRYSKSEVEPTPAETCSMLEKIFWCKSSVFSSEAKANHQEILQRKKKSQIANFEKPVSSPASLMKTIRFCPNIIHPYFKTKKSQISNQNWPPSPSASITEHLFFRP